jgi:hypothetical protein
MKLELVVIAGQQTAVNTFSGLAQIKLRLPENYSSSPTGGPRVGLILEAKSHPLRVTLGVRREKVAFFSLTA